MLSEKGRTGTTTAHSDREEESERKAGLFQVMNGSRVSLVDQEILRMPRDMYRRS